MPVLQFETSLLLGSATILSAFIFARQVPAKTDDELPKPYQRFSVDSIEQLEGLKDPFDVTVPEDIVDGEPIDGKEFWAEVRISKLILTFVALVLVIIQTVSLGWIIASSEPNARTLTPAILHFLIGLYILGLSAHSVPLNQTSQHFPVLVHISALSCLATLSLALITILPLDIMANTLTALVDGFMGMSAFVVQTTVEETDPMLMGLWYTSLALWTTICVISATTKSGPKLHFPAERIYTQKTLSSTTPLAHNNVTQYVGASVVDILLFSYTTPVVMLGYTSTSLEIRDLPIVEGKLRASRLFIDMRNALKRFSLPLRFNVRDGSGFQLIYRALRANGRDVILLIVMACLCAGLFYAPAFFLQRFVHYLERDPGRLNMSWGWVYCLGLLVVNIVLYLAAGQMWSAAVTLQVRLRLQISSILYAKTLVRRDVAGSSSTDKKDSADKKDGTDGKNKKGADKKKDKKDKKKDQPTSEETPAVPEKKEEDDFSTKAQIMTLSTTDVDRVADFSFHLFSLFDAPLEILIGGYFLYTLLGSSSFVGLLATCLFLPLNHVAGKFVVTTEDNLMATRDERVALMNEVLGGIRMLKFMAWERSFEKRVMKIRARELSFQRRKYLIETIFNGLWNASPIVVTLVSFYHYTIVRQQPLTPSIAFTSLSVFNELKFSLNVLPETFISMLQGFVSLRRIEKYLATPEVAAVPPLHEQDGTIALVSATISWPQNRTGSRSASGDNTPSRVDTPSASGSSTPSGTHSRAASTSSTPRHRFSLLDVTVNFPQGELSLICGKLGSGKTLLLLSLLGEAEVLSGQLLCPRSPPNALATYTDLYLNDDEWLVPGLCAYVPQVSWLRNQSIQDNILFNLPFNEARYRKTLEACALLSDLEILEDGDSSEIGERGVNLSGGQKARVSLARAVYSRATVLLLDDVLSAVDAHTARHLFERCLRGELMEGRTVILVSHHVQLCAPQAAYIAALDNGRLKYAGDRDGFLDSTVMATLVQANHAMVGPEAEQTAPAPPVEDISSENLEEDEGLKATASGTATLANSVADVSADAPAKKKKPPRVLVEDEARAVGRIERKVWINYVKACGSKYYWAFFGFVIGLCSLSPVAENGWLKVWSGSVLTDQEPKGPMYYLGIYTIITLIGLFFSTFRWLVLYHGSITASTVLYQRLLKAVLFARIRFHDTVSRGRLLNRFGKDFEGLDSSLSDNFGRTVVNALNVSVTILTMIFVGGFPFLIAAAVLGLFYFEAAKVYGQTSRDMRRLDSVTRSPLYSLYGETISGVTVLRAFGASSKFLRDMLRAADTNANPYFHMWSTNRWLSARFNILSSTIVAATAAILLLNQRVDASLAGFALAFVSTLSQDLLFMVRRFVSLEQSMVALERVQEYTELEQEFPEFVEPRPPAAWPTSGSIEVENLVVKYAPDLPSVLHNLTFSIKAGEKIGVLGRTGGGKSTLALSFFRFVEATEGRILVDGIDISKVGLTDLRGRLTIIPQDPTILSGTLRSTLDVFQEYDDADIFEALRRVHLLPSVDAPEETDSALTENVNVFKDLDSPVSEGGENFSAGEKQLICMARAILKRSKVLFMDEATASVDYHTDELISKTIRQEFAESTIITIAHRLRTVIDYDRVLVMHEGRIAEFDSPEVLLADPNSRFHGLCKAAGPQEFQSLQTMVRQL